MKNIRTFLLLTLTLFITVLGSMQVSSQSVDPKSIIEPTSQVVLMSEVKWEQLNPARGDKSPRAGTLWGERTGSGPAGFLLQPVDGFKSPPHIHNTAYRGVVISGLLHNDDPNADNMWMPTGSFWTQPAGGVHITAAKGNNSLAYIEVEEAFRVLPPQKAFSSDEKPINVDTSNIVWIDQPGMPASSANGAKVAFLWGTPENNQLYGTLIKLPAGFSGKIRSDSTLRAVVIQGQPQYQVSSDTKAKTLVPGSYFSSQGKSVHQVSSKAKEESIIYVRTDGKFEVIAAEGRSKK